MIPERHPASHAEPRPSSQRKRRLSRRITRARTGLPGPEADEAMVPLAAPEIRLRTRVAYIQHAVRGRFQKHVGFPAELTALRLWLRGGKASTQIEGLGLPRRALEDHLGTDTLTLQVDPRELTHLVTDRPRRTGALPVSSAFLWDGDWDQNRRDTRSTVQYRFIQDLQANRHDLTRSERYQTLMTQMLEGRPWKSWQEGLYLNSPERILAYLKAYLGYLDSMAEDGFDPTKGKDPLPVAITREGEVVKMKRGLHRLAMAQTLGLPSIPVRVAHVHRHWWDSVTDGATGTAALERLAQALPNCRPA